VDLEGGAMTEYPAGIEHRRRYSGVSHWRWQRYSAVLVLALMTYFTVLLASLGGLDFEGASALVGHPANALALAVLVTVGLWHGTLGLQVVIEDYITIKGGRQLALIAMRTAMAITGLATLWAISRVAL
jgi:succinate dehydrogenase / fumarate reductase membrane anchor subunit